MAERPVGRILAAVGTNLQVCPRAEERVRSAIENPLNRREQLRSALLHPDFVPGQFGCYGTEALAFSGELTD